MAGPEAETILLVCDCEQRTADILLKLHAAGVHVVGPAPSASMAMAMAAQTPPTIAVVATPPNGRRNAVEFAEDLMRMWGVRSWIVDQPIRPEIAGEAWSADHNRVAHLQAILDANPSPPPPDPAMAAASLPA